MIRKNIEKYHLKYANLWLNCSSSTPFICDLFFETSGGSPLDRFWHPLGYPSSVFRNCWENFKSKFTPNAKGSRAAFRYFVNNWHQPHLQQKQARIQKTITIINPHESLFTFFVSQNHVSSKPRVLQKKHDGNPGGATILKKQKMYILPIHIDRYTYTHTYIYICIYTYVDGAHGTNYFARARETDPLFERHSFGRPQAASLRPPELRPILVVRKLSCAQSWLRWKLYKLKKNAARDLEGFPGHGIWRNYSAQRAS